MKKLLFKSALFCGLFAISTNANAQFDLGGLVKNVISGVTGTSSSKSSSSSSGDGLLSSITNIFSKNKVATKDQIIGTWVYEEPAVVMSSDNTLKNIGAKLATSSIENKLKSKLESYGFKKGNVTMTFDEDGNFTQTFNGKKLTGTYTIDGKSVNLKYAGKVSQVVGTTQLDGDNLLIVMDASKLLKYVNVLGSVSQNSTLKTASSLIGSMDGLECGLKLVKK